MKTSAICLFAILIVAGAATGAASTDPPPTFQVVGGVSPNGQFQPGVFTWLTQPVIYGTHFTPGVAFQIVLEGPINTTGVTPSERVLQSLFADPSGNLDGVVTIPYIDQATVNQRPDLSEIPRPGRYRVKAVGPSYEVFADNDINLSPQTIPTFVFGQNINWGVSRGGRDGWLDEHSPERTDPEWTSIWSEQPVGLYATVAATNDNPRNQPSSVSHVEFPGMHYAHDVNLHLVPDEEYRWVLGTANFVGADESRGTGRIEFEWEFQNDGNPQSYGEGSIGIPAWAVASAGDRVYALGRWVMDHGHLENGDRTEIHPPRLLATMRARDTAVPLNQDACMTRASRVDVYVSGHGGGANRFYDGLFQALENDGLGGGRIKDVLIPDTLPYNTYFAFGPADGTLITLIMLYTQTVADVWTVAGPSGLANDALGYIVSSADPYAVTPWVLGPEERPINDMDYDFDVPLPHAPAGATQVRVNVTTHPEHGTAVVEQISFIDPDPATGLPTKAHVHLPYQNADNGIYARSFDFSWDTFSLPGRHFVVAMNDITLSQADYLGEPILARGPWKLWADVNGRWSFLSGLNPDFLVRPHFGDVIDGLQAAVADSYLDDDDTLRVLTHGYEVRDFEALYAVGRSAYEVGADILHDEYLGSGDNVHVGGALFETPPSPGSVGSHTIVSGPVGYTFYPNGVPTGVPATAPLFAMGIDVTHVPTAGHLGTVGETEFGDVCTGSTAGQQFLIDNIGDENLDVSTITVSGAGFVGYPNPPAPYTLAGSASPRKLDVLFAPTAAGQGAGAITIRSSDVCEAARTIPLHANVIYPLLDATVPDAIFPATVVGCADTRVVTIANTGMCELAVESAAMTGAGYSVDAAALPLRLAPGETAELTVTFAPQAVGRALNGRLTLESNDPASPVTEVAFCGEGVPNGMRVLVVHQDGRPYPVVDKIKLTSHRVTPNSTTPSFTDVPLTSIDSPQSCEPVLFDFETALPTTDPADPFGSFYDLRVQVGRAVHSVDFTLGACEFKQIEIPLESTSGRPRENRSQRYGARTPAQR